MTNNDILRRLRFIFDLSDKKMIEVFAKSNLEVTREQVCDWLKKEEEENFKACNDQQLAHFLNGFVTSKRGEREGEVIAAEKKLSNNMILRKLRIAMNYKDDDLVEVLKLGGFMIGKSELGAFFRKPDHKNYRECKDQVLRHFLKGLQVKFRPMDQAV